MTDDTTKYDSREDTFKHIHEVQERIEEVVDRLMDRAEVHDRSKLSGIEKEAFDRISPELLPTKYGSEEYKSALREIKPALEAHYAANSHHPEHYEDGVSGMSLLDLVEMFCDWKAASLRYPGGDILKSIDHNADRFRLSPQLASILRNTVLEMGWGKKPERQVPGDPLRE